MMAWLKESRVFLLTIPVAFALWYAGSNLPPTSYYYDVGSIEVVDSPTGHPITLKVERIIRREFTAKYFVQVRKRVAGGWEIVCEGNGGGRYKTDAVLPDPLTLAWWSNNENCNTLSEAGQYTVTTTWTIQTFLGWRSTDPVVSNVFVVAETMADSCQGFKVSRRGIIHGPDSEWFPLVGGDCYDTYEQAESQVK